jgi:hypothetical protein
MSGAGTEVTRSRADLGLAEPRAGKGEWRVEVLPMWSRSAAGARPLPKSLAEMRRGSSARLLFSGVGCSKARQGAPATLETQAGIPGYYA